jgi:hypothetical protein
MNPFFNRQRITDHTYFQGRARGSSNCAARSPRIVPCAVGERKLGKSSLLSTIACPDVLSTYGLDPPDVFVYLDLKRSPPRNATISGLGPRHLQAAMPTATSARRRRRC